MSDNNPHVSVFHFTSRISNAKIRKYKMATERGMGPGIGAGATKKFDSASANGSKSEPTSTPAFVPTSQLLSMEPPPKKQRLKLSVRPKSGDSPGDTIAVSRPKRQSSLRIHYSEEMGLDNSHFDAPSPTESSDLSSAPLSDKVPTPPREDTANSDRHDYGDFMSYYIAGGEEKIEKPKTEAKPKNQPKSTSEPEVARQAPPQTQADRASQQPKANPKLGEQILQLGQAQTRPQPQQHSRHQPQSRPQSALPPLHHVPPHPHPPPPPPIPQPIVHIIDIVHDPKPAQLDTVAIMIQKLEALSNALSSFGGVPAVPQSPPAPSIMKPAVRDARSALVDNLLSNFEDDDSDTESVKDMLDFQLANPDTPDSPLTYGIQFIMNALKSWAEQRMKHQFHQQFSAQQMHLQQQAYDKHRGPGRPRKFDLPGGVPLPSHPVIQLNLAQTPEGIAIKAFQAVLDSGCLQTNKILPYELTRALRHLYMQIDQLINQGSKAEPRWQCMSYSAQISANQARVEKWKEAQLKAQEEMARQQQLAEQQMMMQMGLAMHQQGDASGGSASHAHEIELERRRSMQHAAQQPYNSQQHLHPLQLGSQPPTPNNFATSPSPNGVPPILPPVTEPREATGRTSAYNMHVSPHVPSSFSKGSIGQVQLDRMKMYMPGFLPRSGQSMKFSFAPHNEAALRMFGSQSFPSNDANGSNLPNRGPMSAASPLNDPASAAGVDDSPAVNDTPMLDAKRSIEVINIDDSPPKRLDGASHVKQARAEMSQGHEAPPKPVSGFTAVNQYRSAPTRSSTASSSEESTIEVGVKSPVCAASASTSPAAAGGVSILNELNGNGKRETLASSTSLTDAMV